MEPIEAEVSTRYIIHSKVADIKQMNGQWWALFEGSWEWIGLGDAKPTFWLNDRIKITIEKADLNAFAG